MATGVGDGGEGVAGLGKALAPYANLAAVTLVMGMFAWLGYTSVQQAREDRALFRDEIRRQQALSDRQWEAVRANQVDLQKMGENLRRLAETIQMRQYKMVEKDR